MAYGGGGGGDVTASDGEAGSDEGGSSVKVCSSNGRLSRRLQTFVKWARAVGSGVGCG